MPPVHGVDRYETATFSPIGWVGAILFAPAPSICLYEHWLAFYITAVEENPSHRRDHGDQLRRGLCQHSADDRGMAQAEFAHVVRPCATVADALHAVSERRLGDGAGARTSVGCSSSSSETAVTGERDTWLSRPRMIGSNGFAGPALPCRSMRRRYGRQPACLARRRAWICGRRSVERRTPRDGRPSTPKFENASARSVPGRTSRSGDSGAA